jgi:hypothetical protein
MTDQLRKSIDRAASLGGSRQVNIRISDSGELEEVAQPLTWDGEPLYSPATVAEGLFDATAFEQLPGQTAIEIDNSAEMVEQRRDMFRGFGWGVS